MTMRSHLSTLRDSLRLVGLADGQLPRWLFPLYLRVHLGWALRRLLRIRPGLHRLLGFHVESVDEGAYVRLVDEIFLGRAYAFQARRPDPFILDLGANIGLATLFFKTIYPAARVVAFEPDPLLHAVLSRNVERNALRGVTARQAAIFSRPGGLDLRFDPRFPASGFWGLANGSGQPARTVEAIDLSGVITEPVDFVKMDIEGVEGAVIRHLGKSGTLSLIDQLVIEVHHNGGVDRTLTDVLVPLEAAGFRYQISALLRTPVPRGVYQDVLVYAWK